MRVLRYWWLGLGAACALGVSLAFAADPVAYPECDHKPTPSDQEGAKGAHKAAAQFYDRGDYDKAIRYWLDAYTFDCTAHGVLQNISNAYEKKGDKQAAIAALETYLKRSGPDQVIEAKIKNLKQSQLPPESADASAPPPASASASLGVPSASVSAIPTAPPTAPRPYGAAPWVVVGGGAAVALLGAVLLPNGLSQVSDADAHCKNRMCSQANSKYIDVGNAGRIQVGVGAAALGLGGAAIIGGLVWQLGGNSPIAPHASAPKGPAVSPAAPRPVGVKVSPAVGPGHAGVTVTGAF